MWVHHVTYGDCNAKHTKVVDLPQWKLKQHMYDNHVELLVPGSGGMSASDFSDSSSSESSVDSITGGFDDVITVEVESDEETADDVKIQFDSKCTPKVVHVSNKKKHERVESEKTKRNLRDERNVRDVKIDKSDRPDGPVKTNKSDKPEKHTDRAEPKRERRTALIHVCINMFAKKPETIKNPLFEHDYISLGKNGCSYKMALASPVILENGEVFHVLGCGRRTEKNTHYCDDHQWMVPKSKK
jgi:hypothetical protein